LLPGSSFLIAGPALVRGSVQARRNTFGGSKGQEKEIPVHELIFYRF